MLDNPNCWLADMTMDVDFDGNTISGTIDNVNFLDETDEPEQLLGGSLSISGAEADGILTATATGSLSAVGDERVRGYADVTLSLSGNVLTDTSDGDTVQGDVTGTGTGDYELTMTEGGFYGSSN